MESLGLWVCVLAYVNDLTDIGNQQLLLFQHGNARTKTEFLICWN